MHQRSRTSSSAGRQGNQSPSLLLSRQEALAVLWLCWWFSLLQNSMGPTGLAWEDMLYPLYQKYKNAITWGDQDLLNIIFYFNPGRFSFQNAICVGVRPPHCTEHIPDLGYYWRASVTHRGPVFCCPRALLSTALGIWWRRLLGYWHKRPNVETSNTGLHFLETIFFNFAIPRSRVKIDIRHKLNANSTI